MMRENSNPKQADQIAENPQHSHDFFVVSSCKIHVKLLEELEQPQADIDPLNTDPIVVDFTRQSDLKGEVHRLYDFIGTKKMAVILSGIV